MKIWLDDKRPPPDKSWTWLQSGEAAIVTIDLGRVEEISFDHDLGPGPTGYDVANAIERLAAEGELGRIEWSIHSANPVGYRNIERAMLSAERFWEKNHVL